MLIIILPADATHLIRSYLRFDSASGTNNRESTDIGSVLVLANEASGTEKQITLNASKIQEMVSGAFTNNGFIVIADTELDDRFNYKSSDASTSSQRPKLVIEYTTSSATPTPTATAGPSPTPTRTPTPVGTNTPTVPPTVTPTSQPAFQSAAFRYDGDGKRVKSTINSAITTYFVGAHYEVSGSTVTKYYYAGAQRIAMRTGGTLSYLLGDHLGSTSLTTDAAGNKVSEIRYKAWGEVRYATQGVPTRYQYTGQYSYEPEFGLYFYNARWYDSYLNHFTQPDTIVPDPYNSQDWNRYAYARNNPLKYTDPTGHDVDCSIGDSYCSESRREYHYSKWKELVPGASSFKWFMRAKDAEHYYNNHPDKAIEDYFGLNSNGEVAVTYVLGNLYSENVKHEYFNPIKDDDVIREIDRIRASGEPVEPYLMALVFGFGVKQWMSQDEGGGGGPLDISPSQSTVWKNLDHYRGGIRRSGSGRDLRYYEWDYTHGDIEVYDRYGNHLGSMNPLTGQLYKPPVKGRTINIK